MRNTGIIVARFQCSHLHEAHKKLIEYVSARNKRVIIILGDTSTRLTHNNPLSYEIRRGMVQQAYPNIQVCGIKDEKNNDVWNNNLDLIIEFIAPAIENERTLYGSRDSFLSHYTGKIKTEHVDSIVVEGLSATELRKKIHNKVRNTEEWREGAIWASAHKYPSSYQTVDVAVVNFDNQKILLGRKKGEAKFRFVGGFVDPTDESLERAGKREVLEECGGIETDAYEYIGSYRIDDWRYRNETDKIMTAFFCCHFIYGHAEAKDDIEEVQWIDLHLVNKDLFEPEHKILLDALKSFLRNKYDLP